MNNEFLIESSFALFFAPSLLEGWSYIINASNANYPFLYSERGVLKEANFCLSSNYAIFRSNH